MRNFQFTPDFIDWELDGAQGWAYANWATENESSVWGNGIERKSPGYVKQEYNKLMKQYYDGKSKSR